VAWRLSVRIKLFNQLRFPGNWNGHLLSANYSNITFGQTIRNEFDKNALFLGRIPGIFPLNISFKIQIKGGTATSTHTLLFMCRRYYRWKNNTPQYFIKSP